MQGKGPILLQSFSRSQFNGSGASGSSTFSFGDSLRPPKDTNMVILDDDGLILVQLFLPSMCTTIHYGSQAANETIDAKLSMAVHQVGDICPTCMHGDQLLLACISM